MFNVKKYLSNKRLITLIIASVVILTLLIVAVATGTVKNTVKCPDCGKEIKIFGESHVNEIAAKYGLPVLARMPIDPKLASLADAGKIEEFEGDYLDVAVRAVAALGKA